MDGRMDNGDFLYLTPRIRRFVDSLKAAKGSSLLLFIRSASYKPNWNLLSLLAHHSQLLG